jgi:hypothetical protein
MAPFKLCNKTIPGTSQPQLVLRAPQRSSPNLFKRGGPHGTERVTTSCEGVESRAERLFKSCAIAYVSVVLCAKCVTIHVFMVFLYIQSGQR